MAFLDHPATSSASVRPGRIDRLLSIGAVVLFAAAVAAIVRGHDQWRMVPPLIWLHLATILVATVIFRSEKQLRWLPCRSSAGTVIGLRCLLFALDVRFALLRDRAFVKMQPWG